MSYKRARIVQGKVYCGDSCLSTYKDDPNFVNMNTTSSFSLSLSFSFLLSVLLSLLFIICTCWWEGLCVLLPLCFGFVFCSGPQSWKDDLKRLYFVCPSYVHNFKVRLRTAKKGQENGQSNTCLIASIC